MTRRSMAVLALMFLCSSFIVDRAWANPKPIKVVILDSQGPAPGVKITILDGDGNVLVEGVTAADGVAQLQFDFNKVSPPDKPLQFVAHEQGKDMPLGTAPAAQDVVQLVLPVIHEPDQGESRPTPQREPAQPAPQPSLMPGLLMPLAPPVSSPSINTGPADYSMPAPIASPSVSPY